MKKCTFCGNNVNDSNLSAKDILNNAEWKKYLKLKKDKLICTNCKTDYIMLNLI